MRLLKKKYSLTLVNFMFTIFVSAQIIQIKTIPPTPMQQFNVFCKGQCIQFLDSSFNAPWAGIDTIMRTKWYFQGTSNNSYFINNFTCSGIYSDTFEFNIPHQNPPILCYDIVGEFDVCYESFTALGGGSGSPGTKMIKIIDAPINTGVDTQFVKLHFGDEYILTACAQDNHYNWLPANEPDCSTCANYSIKPFSNTTYTCTITNDNGCEKKCIYNVELENLPEALFIPNSFTPNNDGLNDIFKPISLNQKIILFSIYNSWGEKIVEMHDENASWDGMHKGLKTEEGVYNYIIMYSDIDNNIKKTSGIITLIR
jgi:gliding motility-associated-like protein